MLWTRYDHRVTRYKLTIAYDGAEFHGWQRQTQPNRSDPDGPHIELRTVQQTVERAVIETVRQPVQLVGASRTDARVHAVGQVAAFTAQTRIPIERLHLAINARLPDDVEVRRAEIVADDFDPIKNAVSKGYRYTLHIAPTRPLTDRHRVYHCFTPIDPARMQQAADLLIGTHDFESFASIHHGRTSTVRTIFSCDVSQLNEERVVIDVSGDGFLYNMVRIIAGTLVEVGRGHDEPEAVRAMLEAKDRRAAGPTFPPQGLCLMWIKYDREDTP
ncbi:MAG: tRNA pseudouridine(38-40) synthase TruA [Phycisphaerales bacterium]|nr:tRNA pseudouridine(38-40) synthase TruA [Phycisphaerales bacterium]